MDCYTQKQKFMEQMITIKRAYEPAAADDGFRVYIDRLWPRGLSHETFHYDLWDKEIAPTTELREWFHEDPDNRWTEFEKRYRNELLGNPSLKSLLDAIAGKPTVTLLYSSRDHEHNNAVVVKNVISEATPVQQSGDQH